MQSPQQLFARLQELGIAQRTVKHPPVFTVEQAKALRGDLPAIGAATNRARIAREWSLVVQRHGRAYR